MMRCKVISNIGRYFFLCVLAMSSALTQPAGASSLVLVRGGKAEATILIPAHADSFTKMAAEWVQSYVAQCSGAKLSVVTEDNAPSGALISVGHTKLAADAGITTDELK